MKDRRLRKHFSAVVLCLALLAVSAPTLKDAFSSSAMLKSYIKSKQLNESPTSSSTSMGTKGHNTSHAFDVVETGRNSSSWAQESLNEADGTRKEIWTANQTLQEKTHETKPHPEETVAANQTNLDPSNETEETTKGAGTVKQQKPHPFAGARYPDGTWGYVADVTLPRRHMMQLYEQHQTQQPSNQSRQDIHPMHRFLPMNHTRDMSIGKSEFDLVCQTPGGKGFEGDGGFKMMMSRMQVNGPDPPAHNVSDTSRFRVDTVPADITEQRPLMPTTGGSRILCVVYTYGGVKHRVDGIVRTFGWRYDGFMAASTITVNNPNETGFGSVDLPHVGEESYNSMWQKTRSIAGYLYENYLDDFEYFHIMGDDTHVVVENLRNYLHSLEQKMNISSGPPANSTSARTHQTVPLYVGQTVPAAGFAFGGGGPGYILNRAALKLYIEKAKNCMEGKIVSSEDRFMGMCLNGIGIRLVNTADAQKRQVFVGFDPNLAAKFNGKHGYFARLYSHWANAQGLGFKVGNDLISTQAVALHLFKTVERMKRMHAILYRACPVSTVLGKEQLAWDQSNKPTPIEEIMEMSKLLQVPQ